MLSGVLRIVMSAGCASGDGFTFFDGRLAATVGVNMEAVLAGRQRFQVRSKLKTFRGFTKEGAI